jgi:hypothetical protein
MQVQLLLDMYALVQLLAAPKLYLTTGIDTSMILWIPFRRIPPVYKCRLSVEATIWGRRRCTSHTKKIINAIMTTTIPIDAAIVLLLP